MLLGENDPSDKEGARFHLLPYHCLDVSAVGLVLLRDHRSLLRHLSDLVGMEKCRFMDWMTFFLALHDLGKFADAFQNSVPDLLHKLQQRSSNRGRGVRHDSLGYLLWDIRVRRLVAPQRPRAEKSRRRPSGEIALDFWIKAVTGHHGQPPVIPPGLPRDYFEDPNDLDAAEAFVEDIAGILLAHGRELPPLDGGRVKMASWWLAGFTVLCDWLASGRAPSSFQSDPKPLKEYWGEILPWAKQRVAEAGLLPAQPSSAFGWKDLDLSKQSPLQAKAESLPLGEGPHLFILEDVTGAGKTEAAVLLLHRLMAKCKAGGVYLGLPTMATANAMYRRMGAVYRRLYNPDDMPSLIWRTAAAGCPMTSRDLFSQQCRPSRTAMEMARSPPARIAGLG